MRALIFSVLLILALPGCNDPEPCIDFQPSPASPVKSRLQPVVIQKPGSISGSVLFVGDIPPQKEIQTPADLKIPTIVDDSLIIDPVGRGIKNAVVRLNIDDESPAPDAEQPPTINIKGYQFTPRVLLIKPGSNLTFVYPKPNEVAFNIHSRPLGDFGMGFHIPVAPIESSKIVKGTKYLYDPDIHFVQDDIYPWMRCILVVHDPRYARITARDGKFEFKGLRPGKYTLSVFQEKLGEKQFKLEVKEAENSVHEFKLEMRRR